MHVLSALYDEIVVEARDGIEDQVEAIVKESMEKAFKPDHRGGPVCGGDQSGCRLGMRSPDNRSKLEHIFRDLESVTNWKESKTAIIESNRSQRGAGMIYSRGYVGSNGIYYGSCALRILSMRSTICW